MRNQAMDFWHKNGLDWSGIVCPDMFGLRQWPVITLWEPWASAIPLGLKKVETRHWATGYKGPILIHAAKRPVDWPDDFNMEMIDSLHGAGVTDLKYFDGTYGKILAYAELAGCIPTERYSDLSGEYIAGRLEQAWGNFAAERFAWILHNVRRISLIKSRGFQRIWHYGGPIEILPKGGQA